MRHGLTMVLLPALLGPAWLGLHPPDVDSSGAVDLLDFALFQNEFGQGVGAPLVPQIPYRAADLDADGDVDARDHLLLTASMHGPQSPRPCSKDFECDDADPCTQDMCFKENCLTQSIEGCCYNDFDCGDYNPCTTMCTPIPESHPICFFPSRHCCFQDADCNDGNYCNGLEYCDTQTNECFIEGFLYCDDNSVCTADSCEPETGCVHTPAIDCDDNSACTVDSCNPLSGACNHTDACDDLNPCTIDSCDQFTNSCSNFPIDQFPAPDGCNDLNSCTADSCDPATGNCINVVDCDDGDDCTIDSCAGGGVFANCLHVPIFGCCYSPGYPCTPGITLCCSGSCCSGVCLEGQCP